VIAWEVYGIADGWNSFHKVDPDSVKLRATIRGLQPLVPHDVPAICWQNNDWGRTIREIRQQSADLSYPRDGDYLAMDQIFMVESSQPTWIGAPFIQQAVTVRNPRGRPRLAWLAEPNWSN